MLRMLKENLFKVRNYFSHSPDRVRVTGSDDNYRYTISYDGRWCYLYTRTGIPLGLYTRITQLGAIHIRAL